MSSEEAPGERAAGIAAPVGFTGLCRVAWRLVRHNYTRVAGPFLLMVLTLDAFATLASPGVLLAEKATLAISLLLFARLVAFQLVGSILVGLAAVVFTDGVLGVPTTIGSARRDLQPLMSQLVAAGLYSTMLALVAVFVPLLSLALPPLLLGPPVLSQVIALERKPLPEAAPRARGLLSGSWLRILTYLLMLSFALQVGRLMVLVIGANFLAVGLSADIFVILLGSLVSGAFILPLMAAASTVGYMDVRARREDFDFDVLAAEVNASLQRRARQ